MQGDISYSTLATCFLWSLKFGLEIIERHEVIAWADQLILAQDEPEFWLIDLSTSPLDDIESKLLERSDGLADHEALNQFLGYVSQLWENGEITVGSLRSIGWNLHCEGVIEWTDESADWGVTLECIGEELEEGWIAESTFREFASESLQRYKPFIDFSEVMNDLRAKVAGK